MSWVYLMSSIEKKLEDTYSSKDASKVLGCSMTKVRQFIKYDFLDTFKVGQKIMITSESLKRLMENNLR